METEVNDSRGEGRDCRRTWLSTGIFRRDERRTYRTGKKNYQLSGNFLHFQTVLLYMPKGEYQVFNSPVRLQKPKGTWAIRGICSVSNPNGRNSDFLGQTTVRFIRNICHTVTYIKKRKPFQRKSISSTGARVPFPNMTPLCLSIPRITNQGVCMWYVGVGWDQCPRAGDIILDLLEGWCNYQTTYNYIYGLLGFRGTVLGGFFYLTLFSSRGSSYCIHLHLAYFI